MKRLDFEIERTKEKARRKREELVSRLRDIKLHADEALDVKYDANFQEVVSWLIPAAREAEQLAQTLRELDERHDMLVYIKQEASNDQP